VRALQQGASDVSLGQGVGVFTVLSVAHEIVLCYFCRQSEAPRIRVTTGRAV